MDTITTARLVLRNFRATDAADLYAYLKEPRSSCFLSLKLDDMDAAEAEAEQRSRSDEHIAVSLRDSDKLIGDMFASPEEDTFSVGWNFNADFSRRGFALEAAQAMFAHLFTTGGARRLYAYVEDHNIASQRLCERLGMRQEGLFREFVSFKVDDNGEPVFENTMQYAVLRKEWASRQ